LAGCVGDPLANDGLAVLVGRGEAASCGLWSPTGYRTARLIVACAVDDPREADGVGRLFVDRHREPADDPRGPQAWLAVGT
jgi:hypothetical protein